MVIWEYTVKQVCEHYVLMVMWEYTVKQVCEHYVLMGYVGIYCETGM